MKHTVRRVCRWSLLLVTGLLPAGCQTAPPPHPERVEVTEFRPKTTDGWELELKRFRLKDAGQVSSNRMPVILCHGRTSNGNMWNLTRELSFAVYLAEAGYDVWVPSLRGACTSSKPGFHVIREMVRFKMDNATQFVNVARIADPRKFDWTFDDYVFRDIPAIIDTVKRETGHAKVVWVGKSMGGMVMYAYLEHAGRDDVGAFIPIASPIIIPQPTNDIYTLVAQNPQAFKVSLLFVNSQLPNALAALGDQRETGTFARNPHNMDPEVSRKYLLDVSEDVAVGVTDQLVKLARTGELKSANGKLNYTADLHLVRVPVLLMVGKADNMCEPAAVRYVYEHISSTDKTYREFGLANGYSADYGHVDIMLGKKARSEVYPYILDWLRKHDHKR